MLEKNYFMCNVVFYDGVDSYVCKFIIKDGDEKPYKKEIETSTGDEILKIDKLYTLSFSNIVAILSDSLADEKQCRDNINIAQRYSERYM